MIEERIKYLFAFVSFVIKRFNKNQCSSIAAELTVTSLLALVPLTTVVFALLAFIPSFQEFGEDIQTLLFKYFVPGTGETVQVYINEFVGKARGLSGLGTLMLIVTALLMMRTIDSSFNQIWYVKSNKSLVRTLLVYWAVLTLGPILVGSSVLITSYIKSLLMVSNVVRDHGQWLTLWLPFLMAGIAFSVMFYVIPNRKIRFSHAVISGLITASLFEIAKFLFGLFVTSVSTYQLIFGALAAVPLFLIWIYLSWGIVLLGAEICHAMEAFEPKTEQQKLHPFIEVTNLLMLLADFQKSAQSVNEEQLSQLSKPGQKGRNLYWIEQLLENGVVFKSEDQSYCLVSAAEGISFATIFNISGRRFPSSAQIDSSDLPIETQQKLHLLIDSIQRDLSDHPVI